MIYTGLDWSGDPGDPERRPGASSLLVVVGVSMADHDLPMLRERFVRVRAERRLPESHCFKHITSKPGVRDAFFRSISPLFFQAHAVVIDKRVWSRQYLAASTGLGRISDAIADLVICCPDDLVAQQMLLVDLDRSATHELRTLRSGLRRTLTACGRRTFDNVKACPDHRGNSELVQFADMIAGELREWRTVDGPLLTLLSRKLMLCR